MINLTGIARFRIVEELATSTPFRRCRITAAPFAADFHDIGNEAVDRDSVLKTFGAYLSAHNLDADWEAVGRASNETLVNTLAMMAPFGPAEKQALLEAPDLRARAETLVAITEMSLAADRRRRADAPLGGHHDRSRPRRRRRRPQAPRDPRLPADQDDARVRRRSARS